MYLVGFIIRTDHNARSPERQIRFSQLSNQAQQGWLTVTLPVQCLNLSLKLVKLEDYCILGCAAVHFGP
jgi:hypothetical protein